MSAKMTVTLAVNGRTFSADCEPRRTLADFLRQDLGFAGVHLGCEHGVCGACTVMVDGSTARSCCMFAVQADGAEIATVEGLGADGTPARWTSSTRPRCLRPRTRLRSGWSAR
jgi:aerobic carbon-monoxide dehydrogenase small subunit